LLGEPDVLHPEIAPQDAAMTLFYALKGILMTVEDRTAFTSGMAQVIRTVLKP